MRDRSTQPNRQATPPAAESPAASKPPGRRPDHPAVRYTSACSCSPASRASSTRDEIPSFRKIPRKW